MTTRTQRRIRRARVRVPEAVPDQSRRPTASQPVRYCTECHVFLDLNRAPEEQHDEDCEKLAERRAAKEAG
jgi:hypothetical protein